MKAACSGTHASGGVPSLALPPIVSVCVPQGIFIKPCIPCFVHPEIGPEWQCCHSRGRADGHQAGFS